MSTLTIRRAGWSTTIQDRGRRGFAHLGVPVAGAIDPGLADLVNRLVGNTPGTPVIETAGGLEVEVDEVAVIASSRAPAPVVIEPGESVAVDHGGGRNFHYLAVRGGLDVDRVLGSASSDSLAGVGATAVVDGARIRVGPEPDTPVVVDLAPVSPLPDEIRLWPGPRIDWFAPDAMDVLCSVDWTTSTSLSRVGVRLDGAVVPRSSNEELPSEGIVLGAVQVPHDGVPVVMLADHPTTGGYPVAAVVDPRDVFAIGQSPPGRRFRFVGADRRMNRRG